MFIGTPCRIKNTKIIIKNIIPKFNGTPRRIKNTERIIKDTERIEFPSLLGPPVG